MVRFCVWGRTQLPFHLPCSFPFDSALLRQYPHAPKGPCTQESGTCLGFRVIVIIVQVLGKYIIIRYLDPYRVQSLFLPLSQPYMALYNPISPYITLYIYIYVVTPPPTIQLEYVSYVKTMVLCIFSMVEFLAISFFYSCNHCFYEVAIFETCHKSIWNICESRFELVLIINTIRTSTQNQNSRIPDFEASF